MRAGVLLLVALSLAALVGAPGGSGEPVRVVVNHQTFNDPIGDATGNAPDIGTVDVSNDDSGTIVFRVALANRAELLENDTVEVFVDVDRNKATGCGGLEYALRGVGHAPREPFFWLRTCTGDDFGLAVPQRTFNGSFDASAREVVLSVNRREIKYPKRMQFAVRAFAGEADFDSAGDERVAWLYELITPPDRTAPHVKALRSSGVGGTVVNLAYHVFDDSGRTREEVTVVRAKKLLFRHRTKLLPSDERTTYAAKWRVPRSVSGRLRFCVRAWDEARNRAGPSCAPVTIR
jgi:hypothetical protein